MNKRIKKKVEKKFQTSLNLGYDHMLSYSEIKWVKKVYHKYDLCLKELSNSLLSVDLANEKDFTVT